MKKSNLLSAVILLTGFSSVFGQTEQPKTIKKVSIKEIYIQRGFFSDFFSERKSGTLTDFKTLAPQSVLLSNDLSAYSPTQSPSISNSMFSVMFGIQFSDKQKTTYKTNPLLRLGVSYFSGIHLTCRLYKEDNKIYYDTLTSTRIDSVTKTWYSMYYSSQQLRFDGSLIFRTNPEARWSLFTGIGITAGLSINANTSIDYYKNGHYAINVNGTYTAFLEWFSIYKAEKFRNKNNLGLSTYIPMGIDFRIGKKREFWKRTHLFYELRPNINIISIPELRTITNASFQHGFGLKVSW